MTVAPCRIWHITDFTSTSMDHKFPTDRKEMKHIGSWDKAKLRSTVSQTTNRLEQQILQKWLLQTYYFSVVSKTWMKFQVYESLFTIFCLHSVTNLWAAHGIHFKVLPTFYQLISCQLKSQWFLKNVKSIKKLRQYQESQNQNQDGMIEIKFTSLIC